MLNKLEHAGIMVADMDRAIRFYTQTLGLPLRERRTFGTVDLAFLSVGDTEIELICGDADYVNRDGLVHHLAFTVTDLDSVIDTLRQRGVTFDTPEPTEVWNGYRIIFFRGPDGEKLELFERGRTTTTR